MKILKTIMHWPRSYQNTQTKESGLPDFPSLVTGTLNMYLPNDQPEIIASKYYKNWILSVSLKSSNFNRTIWNQSHQIFINVFCCLQERWPLILIKDQLICYQLP